MPSSGSCCSLSLSYSVHTYRSHLIWFLRALSVAVPPRDFLRGSTAVPPTLFSWVLSHVTLEMPEGIPEHGICSVGLPLPPPPTPFPRTVFSEA